MEIQEILAKCDHTLLKPEATWEQVRALIEEGIQYGTASVCISPCFVRQAAAYSAGRLPICTVIGFPSGAVDPNVKAFEAAKAVEDGADEIDMVIHIGALKAGDDAYVLEEIKSVRKACNGKLLKVIIETCLLTEEEKIRACRIVTQSGAEFIKTSTGFSTGGATKEDVALMRANVGPEVKIKAAGGIADLQDAEEFINLGADRLGTSRIVKIVQGMKQE